MPAMPDNPLSTPLRGTTVPFDRVRGEHVVPAIEAHLGAAQARLAALEASSPPHTYDSTLAALEEVTLDLSTAMGVVQHLESVATSPPLRDAYNAVQPRVSAFYSQVTLSSALWTVLRDYAATEDAASLTGERHRFLHKTLDEMRRGGAGLDEAGKGRLAAIDVEIAQLAAKFAQNTLDASAAFELCVEDEARLRGLPESAQSAAAESARQRGRRGFRFTLQAPSYAPFMTYLEDGALRETMYRAFQTRATRPPHDNAPLVARLVGLRREKARLLGYATFADLVLADRMAKNAATAGAFVDDLRRHVEPAFDRENQELAAFRREIEGPRAPPLAAWDLPFYAEKLRRERFTYDEEALRQYFPADAVLEGIFEIARRLFGVVVAPWTEGARPWHADVRAFEMRDASGHAFARFYVDAFPRETKQDGAWMHGIVHAAAPEAHLGVVCANFSPPIGGRPALLTRREVETMLHEFGHLLHHALSRVGIRSLAGTQVATDFVELPSKLMENWCWTRESLDLLARHHETGAPIPDDVLTKMQRARSYRAANALMRQLGFAATDLALHTCYDPERDGDPIRYSRAILQAHSPAPLPEDHAMVASFTHLFADPIGYAAGYYSYQWSEVLDADAFTRFQREGIFDPKVGKDFVDCVLSRGNGEDPMVLYERFMGRKPTAFALLTRAGLLP